MTQKMLKKEWMVEKSVVDLLMCNLRRETENVSILRYKKMTTDVYQLRDPWEPEIRDGDQVEKDDEADREVGIVADAVEADLTRAKVDDKEDDLARVQSPEEKHEDALVRTLVDEKRAERNDRHDLDLEVNFIHELTKIYFFRPPIR